ncbi:hypothetical protein FW778_18000 [Ginsengibacter hankyongi]|uniref:Uncharacterized protein n=1 Tax=Ginsengibacter hankyongi TaxID=2607284 RepID=A0A5J5IFU4_9BACT|nr:hypothetical protein [Ginsengibacter hankyongi]KAA9036513.1 hypothetical protein FW778_18000 [Ginsengibacter hankyongi]
MAQLHVQPKRNNYWWLWLLIILIIVAGAVYWYLNYYRKEANSVYDKTASTTLFKMPVDQQDT